MVDRPRPAGRGSRLPRQQFTDRLFFAVFPDGRAAGQIARLTRELQLTRGLMGQPLATDRLHVSLYHVGDYRGLPEDVVAAASKAASAVAMPRFTVAFNEAASFRGRPGNQPFILRGDDGIVGLIMLQDTLATAMEKAGLGRRAPRYTPHVTLLYGDRFVAAQDIGDPVRWSVHEFVLVHSLLGRSRYVALARFALKAAS